MPLISAVHKIAQRKRKRIMSTYQMASKIKMQSHIIYHFIGIILYPDLLYPNINCSIKMCDLNKKKTNHVSKVTVYGFHYSIFLHKICLAQNNCQFCPLEAHVLPQVSVFFRRLLNPYTIFFLSPPPPPPSFLTKKNKKLRRSKVQIFW